MEQLTKAEEQIMQILWELKKAFVHDIIKVIPDPKPAYNTVSTIVRILEKKSFVDHTAFGKTHQYFPIIKKEQYTKKYVKHFVKNYFSNSYKQMLSFFTKNTNLSLEEMEELVQLLQKEIDQQNKKQ
jgi:BlaI family penicillinase repressor